MKTEEQRKGIKMVEEYFWRHLLHMLSCQQFALS